MGLRNLVGDQPIPRAQSRDQTATNPCGMPVWREMRSRAATSTSARSARWVTAPSSGTVTVHPVASRVTTISNAWPAMGGRVRRRASREMDRRRHPWLLRIVAGMFVGFLQRGSGRESRRRKYRRPRRAACHRRQATPLPTCVEAHGKHT